MSKRLIMGVKMNFRDSQIDTKLKKYTQELSQNVLMLLRMLVTS